MPAPSSHKRTILLVEDYKDSRVMLRYLLESLDYQVFEAKDGHQALELAIRHEPDLILTDFGLPDMDGIELVRQLRKLFAVGSHVPIIMLTAFAGEQYRQSALAAGCSAFCAKPIDFASVECMISSLLSEHLDDRERNPKTGAGIRNQSEHQE